MPSITGVRPLSKRTPSVCLGQRQNPHTLYPGPHLANGWGRGAMGKDVGGRAGAAFSPRLGARRYASSGSVPTCRTRPAAESPPRARAAAAPRRPRRCHVVAVSKTFDLDRANLPEFEAIAAAEVHPTSPDPHASCELVGRHRSPGATRAVRNLLDAGPVDLVHAEGFHLVQHVPGDRAVPLVVADQNIEYQLWEQRHRGGSPRSEAVRAALVEHDRCRQAELAAWRRAPDL
jgi:hypothetical protein